MAHRKERNVDARSRKMTDDDEREERERFVHREERERFVHREDARRGVHREAPARFHHDEDTVRELISSMTEAERARFIDERTRMFEDKEPGRLFGGNRTFGSEDRTRERPRSHGSSRLPERHRRR